MQTHELDVLGSYSWDNITGIGEQTRGGQDDVLGQMVNASANPAFAAQIARRAAQSRPAMSSQPLVKARDWTIGLGPVSGPAGSVQTITISPQCFFRAEKLMASDSGPFGIFGTAGAGFNTTISGIFVGQKNQLPVGAAAGAGLATFAFTNVALGNGVKWDTCQPAISISIQITIGAAGVATWVGVLFGKAVV